MLEKSSQVSQYSHMDEQRKQQREEHLRWGETALLGELLKDRMLLLYRTDHRSSSAGGRHKGDASLRPEGFVYNTQAF